MRLKLYLLIYLFPLFCGLRLSAQDAVPADSLPASPYERASAALTAGDLDAPRAYLEGLSKREKGTFARKMLAAGLALGEFDTEEARHLIEGIKPRQITDQELYDRLSTLLQREERMLQSALPVRVIGSPQGGALSELEQALKSMAEPAGTVEKDSFVPAGGQVRWQVIRKADGRETFGIVYRLGDGSWDEAHIEEVTVLGLDSLGHYAYPYLLSDGETLYFSYSGPETLGGWDVFLSRYNPSERTLLVPQQLPMPVNSPADDYGYIYDESTETAAFITERDTPAGSGKLVKYRRDEGGALPVQKDSLAAYLLFRNTPSVPDETLFGGAAKAPVSAEREPLFWVKDRPVYSSDDLRKPAARTVFARYLSLRDSFSSEAKRLSKLRAEYAKNTSSKASLTSEILALEKAQRSRRAELKALLNEVIKSETN